MVTQVTLFTEPAPNPFEMTPEEFESSSATLVSELNPRIQSMNLQALEVNQMALDMSAAAEGIANAIWVSGTTYAIGVVRYSPIDFYNYRRKTNGAGTIDPSQDSTNWALLTKTSVGGSDTVSSAVDVTLTSASGRLQIISMTAPGKKTTLPSATTLNKGTPIFVVRNPGLYRFSVHKNGGAFICYIQPGQVVAFDCSDTSTAAGVWHANGQNFETIYDGNTPEVLNGVDSRFIAVAMLSATKAICAFRNNVNGFLWGCVLNYGSASGSPLQINSEASEYISIAAQTSGQATVVYKTAAGVTKGYVLDVSSNTITPGAVATIDATALGAGTNIVALSSTRLLCIYANTTSGTLKEKVLDIASSVITPSTEATVDSNNAANSTRRELGMVSSTKALAAFKSLTNTILRLQGISGSTPSASGSALSIPNLGAISTGTISLEVLSTDRAMLIYAPDLTYSDFVFSLIDISGSTPILICQKKTRLNVVNTAFPKTARLDANNIYFGFVGGGSGGIDAVIAKVTSNDKIMIGNLSEKIEPGVASAEGYVDCVALDSTHVMQVCRNASTFLSAKTVEIAA